MAQILWFENYQPADAPVLGGKNTSLGTLLGAGLPVPPGFAVSADCYRKALADRGIGGQLDALIAAADPHDPASVAAAGARARALVGSLVMPADLADGIRAAYQQLCQRCGDGDVPVAVRSSATCEDQPDASFAGEHDTYLWGVDIRFLNGYMYLSPVGVADPKEIEARVPEFAERAGYYFANWDRLYAAWLPKVRALIDELEGISFSPLPDREDMTVITEGRGTGSTLDLLTTYHRLVDLTLKLWHYHFEFLNLGYAAYLDFFGCCKQLFPSIPDQAIAKMVAGIQVDLFQPDDEIKKLARLAVELGLADRFSGSEPAAEVLDGLRGDPQGEAWLAAWEEAKQPWFNFSAGTTFYHTDKVWLEYPDIPLGFLRAYIAKVQRGETLERPMEAVIAERDRIVEEYTELIGSDEDRATFGAKLGLARTVFPYVENHNFYVEHWAHSVIWRKMRDLGRVLAAAGFFDDPDEVFLLSRHEVPEVLFDLYHGWAVGVPSRGPTYWPREMARRSGIMNALRQWSPPPALGVPPEVITEPFTIMLWGITSDSVRQWLGGASSSGDLSGFAASPGVAEGPARVILSADGIGELREGEVLIAPLTAPSWAPVFGKIAATVTDVGGIMSHAAIVCREYGLPAVTGTAFGTRTIKTGQRVRVDGEAGTVTVIDT